MQAEELISIIKENKNKESIRSKNNYYQNSLTLKLKDCFLNSLNKRIEYYNCSNVLAAKFLKVHDRVISKIKNKKYNEFTIKKFIEMCESNDIEVEISLENTLTEKINSLKFEGIENTYTKLYYKLFIEFENLVKNDFDEFHYREIGTLLEINDSIYQFRSCKVQKTFKVELVLYFIKSMNKNFNVTISLMDNKALGYDPFVISD